MIKKQKNIFASLPDTIEKELFQSLLERPGLTIQRIVTRGQTTGWLEQETDEWVILLSGAARLVFEDGGRDVVMRAGDYLHIPAHCRHKVVWTDPAQTSVWLAVHLAV